ncbi:MAG: valine--tRNA ligase [Coriobacteriales bacterium]|jgi:valyl-tRNA synthetase|nr:valine--tRNA ligase [Coriobacteriales bacterium]
MTEMPKNYDPAAIEAPLFAKWLKAGYFERDAAGFADLQLEPYTIVIPPPNVTGSLHMGHALNNTLQDILIRRARMQKRPTRWIVGTDHAGIATQNRVESKLAKEGLTRFDVGREAFVEACWEWRELYGSTIIEQLKGMGCSCDFTSEKFTMDKNYVQAIRKVFVDWYHAGLIYKGLRIINWCPRCTTALADDEVHHLDVESHLWYVKYPLVQPVGETEYLVVATTRPETMLGDTAVAVNPTDPRYLALLAAGAQIRLPLMDRVIPVVADDYVETSFGTGAVKVTPAHDPNDFEIAKRHDLPQINIFTPEAYINENGGQFVGLNRDDARLAVLAELEALGLIDHIEEYSHAVGHCYRCDTVIEPWASEQWFVAMADLAAPAIEVVRDKQVRFNPQRWEKVYFQWMENIRDWCISRQLWWGHRIPVFYCDQCGWQDALLEDQSHCPVCSAELHQDEDVLDTWFSSQLWPFATYGWPGEPEHAADLARNYPTQVLSTARDIIFLWVARMIMSSLYFLDGSVPFADVIIHPTVLDRFGNIMSKSRGNGIDPMDLVGEFGADVMRFGLAAQVTGTQDLKFDREKLGVYRNFATKIHNAARFIFMNLDGFTAAGSTTNTVQTPVDKTLALEAASAAVADSTAVQTDISTVQPEALTLADRWILSRLARLTAQLNEQSTRFEFGSQARALYSFFWNEFCDWYIEFAKNQLAGSPAERASAQRNLVFVLDQALRLLHPMMPFLTESIWLELPHGDTHPSLVVADWPDQQQLAVYLDDQAERSSDLLIAVISALRSTRARYRISPKTALSVSIRLTGNDTATDARLLTALGEQLTSLANCQVLELSKDASQPEQSVIVLADDLEIYIVLAGLIDFAAELARLSKDCQARQTDAERLQKKLANPGFTSKAAPEVISKAQDDLEKLTAEINGLQAQIAELQ